MGLANDNLEQAMLNADQFRALFPAAPADYLPHLNAAMAEAQITTLPRVHAFLAQLGHESMGLRHMQELANGEAYEGRDDLGNTQPGDGRRYKGRGPIQLTGRSNYRAAGKALGLDLEERPEQAATPQVGFRVAAWFWRTRGLNALADKGEFRTITRKINGGLNGWRDRVHWLARVRNVVLVLAEPEPERVPVDVGAGGKLLGVRGFLEDGVAWVPARAVCEAMGWPFTVVDGAKSDPPRQGWTAWIRRGSSDRPDIRELRIVDTVGYVRARDLIELTGLEWDGATKTVRIG